MAGRNLSPLTRKMFIIKYAVNDETFVSPNVFTEERASYLVTVANDNFKRAFHWKEKINEASRRSLELHKSAITS